MWMVVIHSVLQAQSHESRETGTMSNRDDSQRTFVILSALCALCFSQQ